MDNKMIFIDFDGVIFDTEKRIIEKKNLFPNLTWNEFFDNLNWFQLLAEAQAINNSIEIILEGQSRNKKMAILTKIHTLLEMQAKVNLLREKKVKIPIFFVPPHVKKSEIFLPSNGEILIDDSLKNLIDWKEKGGKGILFQENLELNSQFETVKTLKNIL